MIFFFKSQLCSCSFKKANLAYHGNRSCLWLEKGSVIPAHWRSCVAFTHTCLSTCVSACSSCSCCFHPGVTTLLYVLKLKYNTFSFVKRHFLNLSVVECVKILQLQLESSSSNLGAIKNFEGTHLCWSLVHFSCTTSFGRKECVINDLWLHWAVYNVPFLDLLPDYWNT